MKTYKILSAIIVMASFTLVTSCQKIDGDGGIVAESRTTGTFHSVSLAMSATVYFNQDSVRSITISGQQNIIDEVLTQVEGSQLVIKVRKGILLHNFEPVKVYITAPDVNVLEVSGSGDILMQNQWKQSNISATVSGSGSIKLTEVNASSLSADISGSGSITGDTGNLGREDLDISGSGTIDLRNVKSVNVYAETSGSGEMYVTALDLLDVTISGSGNLWYYGLPAINTHISGSGNLKKL